MANKQDFLALRRQAKAIVPDAEVDLDSYSGEELRLLVEELKVHQVELELQHQDLLRAQQALEASRDMYAELYDFVPVGYLTIDGDGAIVAANRTVAHMLGRERDDLHGRRLPYLVAPQDQDSYHFFQRKLNVQRAAASCELRLVRADGSQLYAGLQGKPQEDAGKDDSRFWIVVMDVSERKEIEADLRQAHDELENRVVELSYLHAMLTEEAEEREQAQARLERRNQELTLLNNVMAAVSSSLELVEILTALERLLKEDLKVAGGGIFFYDAAEKQLRLQRNWEFPEPLCRRLGAIPISGSPFERIVGERESILWETLEETPFFRETELAVARPAWRSLLCVPLMAKGEVLGALCLFGETTANFSEAQVTFFKILGQQIGVAIQNAHLFERVQSSQKRLRHLAQRVFTAQEKERYRVSRELHDEAGQALTGLKITIELIRADLDKAVGGISGTEVGLIRQQLDAAVELCEMTMGQVRMLAHDLRPAALENLGLNATLKGFCRDFSQRTQLKIEYAHDSEPAPELPPAVDICLYRFLQEALNNVAKHADASLAQVEFHCDEMTVSLSVQDNGRGFDPEKEINSFHQMQGLGLAGMQERLQAVGGRLLISSRPGEGTRLVAWIPR